MFTASASSKVSNSTARFSAFCTEAVEKGESVAVAFLSELVPRELSNQYMAMPYPSSRRESTGSAAEKVAGRETRPSAVCSMDVPLTVMVESVLSISCQLPLSNRVRYFA